MLHKSGNDAAEGRMLDAGSSAEVCMPDGGSSAEIRISDDGRSAEIRNGKITAKISPNGKITYYNTGGRLLLEEYVRSRDNLKEFVSALCISPREYLPVPGTNDFRLTVRFEADDDEKLFGMGQYQQPYLDLKGCTLELAHRNSQASVPFLLSSRGYGFLWNNPAVGKVTFGKNVTEWFAGSVQQMDYWITAGDTPAEIEDGCPGGRPDDSDCYGLLVQCVPAQVELLEAAREYKRRGLPIGDAMTSSTGRAGRLQIRP